MGKIASDIVALSKKQLDYTETHVNCTKYNRYFDVEAWQFFNTKKNGNSNDDIINNHKRIAKKIS